ncbi:M1 family aminopeptidase [Flavobacterium sp. JP2137]|uniref:M1 family aminopeptidase n=1 Tax=Flavobacterium sp. JP2137 TaxID=3414510 RepID=UPI003D2FC466
MKKITILFALLVVVASYGQQLAGGERDALILGERNRADALLAFNANPNTQNYDIVYQKLDLQVDPGVYYIKGKVTAQFKALEPMNAVVFDLSNRLRVAAVESGGSSLTFTQNQSDELTVQLPATLGVGQEKSVVITYEGAPSRDHGSFTISTHSEVPILWTLSQPFGASDWWPCKQDLTDKVDRLDVVITAPQHYKSVSNGVEVNRVNNVDGTATTHFQHGYPIPAYLVAIAVTNYQIYQQHAGTAPDDFPIVNYLYPEHYNVLVPQLQQTIPIMNLFESLFGTYPYANEKYGHAQFGWGGGMEHATVSFMGAFSQGLVAHELAHQWFGDKVTCGSWQDIWINEGFAEYAAGLAVQELQGENQFRNWKQNLIYSVVSQNGGSLYLTPVQALNSDRIFSSRLTYNKGAMVVHMLRYVLGDQAFFNGIKAYLNDVNLAYKHAYIPDVKTHLETASGRDLTDFFDQWVYGEGFPTYRVEAQQAGTAVTLKVTQTTSSPSVPFFKMPLEVRLRGTSGSSKIVTLDQTTSTQVFEVTADFTVQSLDVDPDIQIISTNNTGTLSMEAVILPQNEVLVYPNPAFTEVYVDLPSDFSLSKVEVFDEKGALVGTFKAQLLSIAHLAKGKYQLTITTTKGVFHKSIIKL